MPARTRELPSCGQQDRRQTTFSNLLAALSFALDLTEGACPGHAVRTCILGMRIGSEIGLSQDLLSDLYYTLLLKDVGCSSNSDRLFQIVGDDEIRAKRLTKIVDWTRFEWKQVQYLLRHAHSRRSPAQRLRGVGDMLRNSSRNAEILIRLRCEQGARVVRDLGLSSNTAAGIHCLDEHWDGRGYPDHLTGEDIPLLARVASVAQTLEVFYREYGPTPAVDVIKHRSGRWFDPEMVRAVVALGRRGTLFQGLEEPDLTGRVIAIEPQPRGVLTDAFVIDSICGAFAGVVDAKSHYTYKHSIGVARAAVGIAQYMKLPPRDISILRRAALLHDIGKLSVPNSILDKPGKLTEAEWACIRRHPFYTYEILSRIDGFSEIARISATHHEKLDGSGYHLGLEARDLCMLSRILTVADMFDALSGERPYRTSMSVEQALKLLRNDAPHAIDADCVHALACVATESIVTVA